MNTQRIVVLGLALVAAVGAALLVRGMMGGGTPKVIARTAPSIPMSEVLVASEALQPGQALDASKVRWEKWPTRAVDASFISHDAVASTDDAVKDTVVRAPIIAGQPITTTAIVHAHQAGFMAAMLTPGMRAISITVTTDSGAGGFILPNDRVDIILTQKSNDSPPRVRARTILSSIRVLAVDQTFKEEKDTKTVLAKTATLELAPDQAELVAKAQNMGQLSLALRPLGDMDADAAPPAVASNAGPRKRGGLSEKFDDDQDSEPVAIIRYGVTAKPVPGAATQEGRPQ